MCRELFGDGPETLQLVPTIDFITELAKYKDSACHAALEGGFLDFLLHIYVIFPTFHMSPVDEGKHQSALVDACRSALTVLSAEQYEPTILTDQPVHHLSLCEQLFPNYAIKLQEEALELRCLAWRRAETHFIKTRLITIISSLSRAHEKNTEFLLCIDIVEFTRYLLPIAFLNLCLTVYPIK